MPRAVARVLGKVVGTIVTGVKFTNPHGSLALAIKNQDGSSTEWVMTLGSATALAQRGIGKTEANALHTRDEIKVKFLPARDGSPPGFLKTVIHAGRARDPDLRR
jgi:hypothetical protein